MTPEQVTTWVHEHAATVTVEAVLEQYTALRVTVEGTRRSVVVNRPAWDFIDAVISGIEAWEKVVISKKESD